MEEKLKLLKKIYKLTQRQKDAINLGLIPRFNRLLEEREKALNELENLKVEKDENLMYDEIEEEIKKVSNDILQLDKENAENLYKQKMQAKKDVDNIVMTKRIIFDTYEKPTNVVGNHFDNKQ